MNEYKEERAKKAASGMRQHVAVFVKYHFGRRGKKSNKQLLLLLRTHGFFTLEATTTNSSNGIYLYQMFDMFSMCLGEKITSPINLLFLMDVDWYLNIYFKKKSNVLIDHFCFLIKFVNFTWIHNVIVCWIEIRGIKS